MNKRPAILLISCLLILLSIALFLWLKGFFSPTVTIKKSEPAVTHKRNLPKPNVQTKSDKKIAYIKFNSIWVVNSDGSSKKSVVRSKPGTYFPSVGWKNAQEISYIECSISCVIYTQNIDLSGPSGNIEEVNLGQFMQETQILAFSWNQPGTQLAYIYKLPDGQMRLDLKSGKTKNIIKSFSSQTAGQGGRGGSLQDEVSIHFSPDDKYILVTNTLGQPSNVDRSTVWVFETNGKEILAIKSDSDSMATQARWLSPEKFFFKYSGNNGLYLQEITSTVKRLPSITFNNSFYNPTLSPNGDIYYWSLSGNSLPQVGFYQKGTSKKLVEGYYKPETLNSVQIIAIKAQKPPGELGSMNPFVSASLSVININTKQTADLDSGSITLFAISP